MKLKIFLPCFFLSAALVISSCENDNAPDGIQTADNQKTASAEPIFQQVPFNHSGIDFYNMIIEDFYHNILMFDYMYNGAGVSVGDVNNDGLPDVYFTGNYANNKLFINQGDLKFTDVTESAGVNAFGTWCNGAVMVDINSDGFLDIYVCRSYRTEYPDMRRNLLFINNQNNTFTEQAKEYGIDDGAHSMQASFFDYDNDGDLDLFVANHPEDTKKHNKQRYELWKNPPASESNKLYRNNGNNTFTDVTQQAGLLDYSFSLGIMAQDFNNDGYTDLYISNDFEEPDLYYLNNGDGTFSERLKENFKHVSFFGMGIDAGDINNDGLTDLVTLDMLAEDNYREKTQMSSMNPEEFWSSISLGYHYQYMRNSLHLNNGNGSFSEIGQMAGIHRTDWSWAPLLADFDNDGYKDLFITNGYRRDSRDKDNRAKIDAILNDPNSVVGPDELQNMLNSMPSTKINNYFYKNNGDYTFSDISEQAGTDIPSFSNGAAYADLDNDGDLDLIINNLMDTAFVFKNMTAENNKGSYLRIVLNGTQLNPNGIGTKVSVYNNGQHQITQQTNTRGYLSTVEFPIHFGCGTAGDIDSLVVSWPDKTSQTVLNVKTNSELTINHVDAGKTPTITKENSTLFANINPAELNINFKHKEIIFDDYAKQVLLPHKMSQFGPCIAVADVNGDDLDDFYIGGAQGQSGSLYLQNSNGFYKSKNGTWNNSADREDTGAHFFDADNDGDPDLYVVSGGNEFDAGAKAYLDRLYINDGKGNFTATKNLIPDITTSGSVVTSSDFDNDGDLDLFVGSRHLPGNYPNSPTSYLLENQNGVFKDVTEKVDGLSRAGMVTDAIWVDFDSDNFPELVITGEWMPVRVFNNKAGAFSETTTEAGLDSSQGWWFSLSAGDFDNDGDIDVVAGNLGLNYKYRATDKKPFHLYSTDFDKNGSTDIVLAFENRDGQFPVRGKQCSSQQIHDISNKFPTYSQFGSSNLKDIYGEALEKSNHFIVTTFSSSILVNNNNTTFTILPLPPEAQFAPVNSMIVSDFDDDGNLDILMAGNLYVSEVETGRADAGTGLLLTGIGDGTFIANRSVKSGFWANKDAKSIQMIKRPKHSNLILVGNNNDEIQVIKLENKSEL
jgi:enediyne biosynthesis protein E4